MTRVACVRLCDGPLTAHLRYEPDLVGRPLAMVDVAGARGRVIACSPEARTVGVAVGQAGHQALAIAPELVVRVADGEVFASACAALADAARSLAPRIETDGPRVYIDLTDLGAMYPSEGGFVAALDLAVRTLGLRVDIGVATGKGVARVAASPSVHGAVVPPGAERAFLAPLPLGVLPLSPTLRLSLTRLGLRTVGDLAALPIQATGTRLGPEATQAITLARGDDRTPFIPQPYATRFEESVSLDWEVHDVAALVFVLKRLVDALTLRLGCLSLAAASVTLSLSLSSRSLDERTLTLAVPTRDVPSIVHRLRASIDSRPPSDAVTAVRLVAVPAPLRAIQLGLFDPPGPAPEAFSLTLAKLTALVGEGQVGAPVALDTHRPYASALAPFDPLQSRSTERETASPETLALHVFRPPRPAEVLVARGQMVSVAASDATGRVLSWSGPFRVSGAWWGDRFERDGYDVVLQHGGRYRVAFDRVLRAWSVEGRYE